MNKLANQSNTIKNLMKAMGINQRTFSKIIGIKAPSLINWIKKGKIPHQRCPQIEKLSQGKLTCEELSPTVCWVRVPDASWPNPRGRPLVDYFAIHSSDS